MNNIYNLKPNQEKFHPISLHKIINPSNTDMCLTKFKVDNKDPNKISEFKYNYKCVYNLKNYNKYMYIPPIGISYSDILILYNIEDIDTLLDWMKSNNKNNYTVNRVINCWIKHNFDLVKKHNKILEKINKILFNDYELDKINSNQIISKWLKNIDNIFYLDYINDIKMYIEKYENKKKYNKNKKSKVI